MITLSPTASQKSHPSTETIQMQNTGTQSVKQLPSFMYFTPSWRKDGYNGLNCVPQKHMLNSNLRTLERNFIWK